jgi:hypothetical protein
VEVALERLDRQANEFSARWIREVSTSPFTLNDQLVRLFSKSVNLHFRADIVARDAAPLVLSARVC